MESVRSAVANGLGFSLSVMKLNHTATYDGGRVVTISIRDDVDKLAIVLVRKQATVASAQVDKFAMFCRDYFTRHIEKT